MDLNMETRGTLDLLTADSYDNTVNIEEKASGAFHWTFDVLCAAFDAVQAVHAMPD